MPSQFNHNYDINLIALIIMVYFNSLNNSLIFDLRYS